MTEAFIAQWAVVKHTMVGCFLCMQTMAALLGKHWQQSTIESALVALRQDVNVAPTAPGGRGEYRNSLAASFLYKFYVHVSYLLLSGAGQASARAESCGWLRETSSTSNGVRRQAWRLLLRIGSGSGTSCLL
jgi:hypothetical protein